jgi:hypothetical protein
MKNLTIKTNSNLFSLINVGMYDSFLSPYNMIDDYNLQEDFEAGYTNLTVDEYWDRFDNTKYVKHIEKLASEFFDGEQICNDFNIKVKTGVIYSPRFYNYDTDNIDFEVRFNYKDMLNYINSNKDEFIIFLKDNYSSYDGFYSFVDNTFEGWLNGYKNKDELYLSVALEFIFTDEFKKELNIDFIYYVNENTFYTEFINDEQLLETVN